LSRYGSVAITEGQIYIGTFGLICLNNCAGTEHVPHFDWLPNVVSSGESGVSRHAYDPGFARDRLRWSRANQTKSNRAPNQSLKEVCVFHKLLSLTQLSDYLREFYGHS
jgi:hypothetical protein